MIKNKQSTMCYRRFGNTDQWLSTITLGGMRDHEGWKCRVISLRPR
jgi:predicted aldo/keto reductase-like oxidoreductase